MHGQAKFHKRQWVIKFQIINNNIQMNTITISFNKYPARFPLTFPCIAMARRWK